jgi:hypothetical protein
MQAWAEQHGIDFAAIEQDAPADDTDAGHHQAEAAMDKDPLHQAAWDYSSRAHDIVVPLKNLSRFHEWAPAVAAAIDTIAWYSGMIPAKIGRALHGLANEDRHVDDDEIQNDWNGSAKVARLAIAESQNAWHTLFAAGETPPDGSIRELTQLLERIDGGLSERFPLAMEFVRPGFDEPEVAAGALTSLAPFEPRRRSVGRRLRGWIGKRGWIRKLVRW